MGGFGSGRPSGSGRDKVEDHRSIDVNDLQRKGCLKPGWSGSWEWTRDGERIAWIDLRAAAVGQEERVGSAAAVFRNPFGVGEGEKSAGR